MCRQRILALILCTVPPSAFAQADAPKRQTRQPGSLEGDVFFLSQGGDLKKGAGLSVELLVHPGRVLEALRRNCDAYKARYDSVQAMGESDEESLINQTLRRADSVINANRFASVSTGISAHYRFHNVPVGSYLLYTRWHVVIDQSEDILAHFYQWIVPVTVHGGSPQTVDLDTGAETSKQVYCGIR